MMLRLPLVLLASFWLVPTLRAQAPAKPLTDTLGDPLPSGAVARLGTLRFKHAPVGDPTIDVAIFSPDGSKIASLVYGQASVRLWDTGSGQEIGGPWSAADRRHTAVVFSPDGATLVVATFGANGPGGMMQGAPAKMEVTFYDIAGSKAVKVLTGQPKSVRALTFADGGKTLVAAGDGVVSWWDVGTGKELRTWKPFADEKQPSEDGGTKTKTFSQCALAPDARSIAIHVEWRNDNNAQRRTNAPVDHEALGFDLVSQQITWRAKAKRPPNERSRFAFSADSRRVAIAMGPDKVEVRNTATGKLIADPLAPKFQGSTSWLGGLALSADGTSAALAGGDSHVIVWKCQDASPPREFVARIAQYWPNSTQCLDFSPDGKQLLVGADADLQLYDLAICREVHPWEGHRGWIDYLAFSADGKRLLSGCADMGLHSQELAAWDATTWKRGQLTSLRTPPWPNVGVVSPEQSVYVGKDGADRFGLYDLSSGKQLGRLNVPAKQAVQGQARGFFSPSGKYYLLSGKDKDKDIEGLYEVPSGKLLATLPQLIVQQSVMESVRPIAFTRDDRLVALVAREDGVINLFEAATGKLRHRMGEKMSFEQRPGEGIPLANLVFSHDGTLLASWNSREIAIHVWDVATGQELLQVVPAAPGPKMPNGPGRNRVHFAFSPDRRMLAVGDNKIQLYELATMSVRRELVGHPDAPVRALDFSPSGHVLASGSADTTVLIWDMSWPGPPSSTLALDRAALENRWQALAGSDAAKAFAALCDLAAAPLESVVWIKEQLKPAVPIDVKRIEELIAKLDDNQYKVRQKATAELLEIGELAVPIIDQALVRNPPLETQLRLQGLRKRMTSLALSGARLQSFRAVEVLERIGTPQAREVLQALAGGAAGALVTTQARGALMRLER